MYHQHGYSVPDAEEHLALPTYLYNNSKPKVVANLGSTDSACAWYDVPCQLYMREQARQAALTQTVSVPEIDKKPLYIIGGVMAIGFGLAAYFLLFKKEEKQ